MPAAMNTAAMASDRPMVIERPSFRILRILWPDTLSVASDICKVLLTRC